MGRTGAKKKSLPLSAFLHSLFPLILCSFFLLAVCSPGAVPPAPAHQVLVPGKAGDQEPYKGHTTFSFSVRYPASFFTVIDNLSLWSEFSRYLYRAYWQQKYGISGKDLALLDHYKEIRKKYSWHSMEPLFMYAATMKEAWKNCSRAMTAKEVGTLQEVFSHFEPDFRKEWGKASFLIQRKKELLAFLEQDRKLFDHFLQDVAGFYGLSHPPAGVDVHLLLSFSPSGSGGEAHAGVQLQVGKDQVEKGLLITLFHETVHLIQDQAPESLTHFIQEKSGSQGGHSSRPLDAEEADLFNEALVYTLADGILTEQYLNVPHPLELRLKSRFHLFPFSSSHHGRLYRLADAMTPLVKECLKKNQRINGGFLERIWGLYQAQREKEQNLQGSSDFSSRNEIHSCLDSLEKAVGKGEQALRELFSPGSVILHSLSGKKIPFLNFYREQFAGKGEGTLFFTGREIYVRGKTAVVLCSYQRRDRQGIATGEYEIFLLKERSQWKIMTLLYS